MATKRAILYAFGILAALVAGAVIGTALLPVNAPVFGILLGSQLKFSDEEKLRARITLPADYRISIFATGLGNARIMQVSGNGAILVSVPREGVIRLVDPDLDGDGRSDGVHTIVSNLNRPHGLLLEGNRLYVAEVDRVTRITFDGMWNEMNREVILPDLPADGGHSTRTIARGPDAMLYVSIGSSCNACIEDSPWRAAIVRFADNGSGAELFADGLRNTVGFDWQPGTAALYGVDNGRDWLGDDFPPDELNRIVRGGFYGWPYFNGNNVPDPDIEPPAGEDRREALPPVHAFAAHVAPLSIRFLQHQTDSPLTGAALVALHGSWNHTDKVGYRLVSLHWTADGRISERPFATGFERDGNVIGRPVDIVEGRDGAIYVSDDFAGVIYRITRG